MPQELLSLPNSVIVQLVYLRRLPNLGDMIHLHAVRSPRAPAAPSTETSYKAMAPFYSTRLANELRTVVGKIDAVVSPPSSRNDAEIYRNRILETLPAVDLTPRFSRKGLLKSATASSWTEIFSELSYAATGDEANFNSVVVVDELVAGGKTAAAVIQHLHDAGLPKSCIITIAAPAWLKSVR